MKYTLKNNILYYIYFYMKTFNLNNHILDTERYLNNIYKSNIPEINQLYLMNKYPKICSTFNNDVNIFPYLNILENISKYQYKTFKSFLYTNFNKAFELNYNLNQNLDDVIKTIDYLIIFIFSMQYFFI